MVLEHRLERGNLSRMFPTSSAILALSVIATAHSFQHVGNSNRLISRLSAIPAPLSNPPTTFLNCVKQAVVGAKKALESGEYSSGSNSAVGNNH